MQNRERFFLKVKNFKCLKDVEIEIKPITLLFGANGSGKSSLIKAVKFLSHNLFSIWVEIEEGGPDNEKYYYLLKDGTDLISFEEIVNDNDIDKKITFELTNRDTDFNFSVFGKYILGEQGYVAEDRYKASYDDESFKIVEQYDPRDLFESFGQEEDGSKKSIFTNLFETERGSFKVTIEFSKIRNYLKPDIKISIEDLQEGFIYTFYPSTLNEDNYYSYDKFLNIHGSEEKTDFLKDALKYVRTIPFVGGNEDNYYKNEKTKRKTIGEINESLLRQIYNKQGHMFWIGLSEKQKVEFYISTLKTLIKIFFLIPEKIKEYFEEMIHLPANREIPKSIYLMKEDRFRDEDYYGLLRELDPKDNIKGPPQKVTHVDTNGIIYVEPFFSTKEFINYFVKEMHLADYVDILVGQERQYGYLTYKTFNSKAKINLSNASSGLLQVLPILYKSYYDREKGGYVIRIIEQPELHLHPWIQSKLAEFFCHKLLRDRNFIIETHSEHLLRKIQVLIAKADKEKGHENLKERVAVYYFDKGSIKEMELEDNGFFKEPWPDGFFDDSYNLARELIYARKN